MNLITRTNCLFVLLLVFVSCDDKDRVAKLYTDWNVYGGSKDNIHYSGLEEVDTTNVHNLQVAWTYRTGDADTVTHSQMQCNPIIVNGVLYGTSPTLKLIAVDAVTGKEKWVFNPHDSIQNKRWHEPTININRGVTYWEAGEDKRVLFTVGSIVYAVDANTGKL